jgi:transposase
MPKGKKKSTNGRPKLNVNGLVFVLKTECAWADMPKVFGSYVTTCWRRLKQWQKDGIWQKLLRQCDEQHKIKWEFCFLDGTFEVVELIPS